jgi:ADP-ribose pyrophosphatase
MIKKFHDPELDEHYISNERVFSGRLLKVELDHVKLPNGSESTREYIRHPGAVAIVPVLEDGSIVLVKQCRYPLSTVMWEIPAGKLEKGEDPCLAALRELEEEAGLKANRVELMFEVYPTPGYSNEIIRIYRAWDFTQTQMNLDEDEFLSGEWIPIPRLKQMIASGEIKDGKTLIALLKALG